MNDVTESSYYLSYGDTGDEECTDPSDRTYRRMSSAITTSLFFIDTKTKMLEIKASVVLTNESIIVNSTDIFALLFTSLLVFIL